MKLLTTLSFFVIFIFVPDSAVAVRNYFWLVRMMPDLRTLVQGLVGVSIPEGATNAAAEVDFFRLSANSLTSRTGTRPAPGIQSGWNIHNLMALKWQKVQQRQITSSGEVEDVFILNTHNYLIGLSLFLLSVSPYSSFRFPFVLPPVFYNIPLSTGRVSADHSRHLLDSGIEILPPDTSTHLIAPMTPVQCSITGVIQSSPLANVLNAVSNDQVSSASSFNPAIANLLATFSSKILYSDGNIFFVPSLHSYLLVSPSTNSVLSLVPHETFIRLDLIPGADSERESHLNPDSWGLGENK